VEQNGEVLSSRGKSRFHTNFSDVFWPLPLRKCNDFLEKLFPKSLQGLGKDWRRANPPHRGT